MLEDLGIWTDALLGLDQDELGAGHMALRAVVVYVVALVMVRWGAKRFMGKSTAFDVILGVVLFGTVYPLITEAFGEKLSIGPPYFNAVFVATMVPVLFLMAIVPLARLTDWLSRRYSDRERAGQVR